MNLPHHWLSHHNFMTLATADSGVDALRELITVEYSKHMTFLWGVVSAAEDSEQSPLARMGYDLLAKAVRENRVGAGTVVRYPSVGAWARRTVLAWTDSGPTMPGAEPGQLRAVAAAAAIRAGVRAEIEVPVTNGFVMLPSLGAALVPGRSTVVRNDSGGTTIGQVEMPRNPCHDAPGWLGLRRVKVGPLDVLIDDLDPFRMPDVQDLAVRLDIESWEAVIRAAWTVLEHHHSGAAAEIAAAVSVIVPRSEPPAGVISTSSPETFGTIGMSLPPDPITCAVTFAHEIQHLKLGALLDLVTLTQPDDGRRYYAPWRDDPRPLGGLFQGAYAYFGVSAFWRRQRRVPESQPQADIEFARWRAATAEALETLRTSGRLTRAGLDFVTAMAHTLRLWQDEPVSVQAVTLARRAAGEHLARWQSSHGPVPAG